MKELSEESMKDLIATKMGLEWLYGKVIFDNHEGSELGRTRLEEGVRVVERTRAGKNEERGG